MMGDFFLAIILMVGGVLFFLMTLKDEKNKNKTVTTSYVMHLKGYAGGIGLFLMGLVMLYRILY
ncbi:hypothetical protein [Flavobacterium sp. NKUCC04_CG]|uniref:hypothetical protein n=1 Tax=Flavobacterium sp. NKUCC04_CG TaxID=2842121 RepID=UPI001C5B6EAD|nr:hypothetical protein [Flavobacterium sp. NKUCC04_CG]MBW3519807.1 hypothetical protein [Flavobacterium sp. NKUCC04_CG]